MAQYDQNISTTAALAELLRNVKLPSYGRMQTYNIQPGEYTVTGGRAQVSPQVLSRMGITPQGSGQQPLRQAVESAGGIVRWQGQGQPIQAIMGSRLLNMIRQQAAALGDIAALNRPNIPAGTPTFEAKQWAEQFAEQKRQFDETMRYNYQQLAQQAALARLRAAGSGGGGEINLDTPTKQQLKNELISKAQARAVAAWKKIWDASKGTKDRATRAMNAGLQEFQNSLYALTKMNPYYSAVIDINDIPSYALQLRMITSQSGWSPLWESAKNFYLDDIKQIYPEYFTPQVSEKATKQTSKTVEKQEPGLLEKFIKVWFPGGESIIKPHVSPISAAK